jgi:hypothetical protein
MATVLASLAQPRLHYGALQTQTEHSHSLYFLYPPLPHEHLPRLHPDRPLLPVYDEVVFPKVFPRLSALFGFDRECAVAARVFYEALQ